jgi:coenzyme F420-reducing hydrogenase alpha subunit
VTALYAVERALGVEVTEATALTRELAVHGGQVQSHALHLFFLVLPDLLKVDGVTGLSRAAPEIVRTGLAIKAAGNLIQETVGGRLIHPVNIALGGLGRRLSRDDLLRLRDAVHEILPEAVRSAEVFDAPAPFPRLPEAHYLAVAPGGPSISADRLATAQGDLCNVAQYDTHIHEQTLAHAPAKLSLVGGKEPTVGALSRLNLQQPPSPLAAQTFQRLEREIVSCDIWGNNAAQAVELIESAERALAIIERLLELGSDGGGQPDPDGAGGERDGGLRSAARNAHSQLCV